MDFGDVRAALQHPPSAEAWERLCHILARQEFVSAEALVYVSRHLRAWPEAFRVAPREWCRAGDPRLVLCRSFRGWMCAHSRLDHHGATSGSFRALWLAPSGDAAHLSIPGSHLTPKMLTIASRRAPKTQGMYSFDGHAFEAHIGPHSDVDLEDWLWLRGAWDALGALKVELYTNTTAHTDIVHFQPFSQDPPLEHQRL